MAAEHEIYSLIRFAGVGVACEHVLLARVTQPSYSNPDQNDENRAVQAGIDELERVTAEYRASVLGERCAAEHDETLLGESQSYPLGDELHVNAPVRDLAIWVADTRFGPPWVILGTAASEAAFWSAVADDDERFKRLGPARQLVVDFFPGPPTPPGRRVVITGVGGAGKTTLGRALAERLNLPYGELDALHHGPDRKSATAAELRARVQSELDDRRGWIVDGNYESKLGTLVLDRAELIVWLDPPLWIKLWRLATQIACRWFRNGKLFEAASRESDTLFSWAGRSHFRSRRQRPRRSGEPALVRLRSPRQVRAWFVDFCKRA